jgi:hypothetical protein
LIPLKVVPRFALLIAGCVLAGVPWSIGAPRVGFQPQEVHGTVSLQVAAGTSLAVNSLYVEALPSDLEWTDSFALRDELFQTDVPVETHEHHWSMLLDGSDPSRSYKLGFTADVSAAGQTTKLRLRDENAFEIGSSAASQPLPLVLHGLRKITATITVTNGGLHHLQVQARATVGAQTYLSEGTQTFVDATGPATLAFELFAPPTAEVWIDGYANVTDAAGVRNIISLTGAARDLTSQDASVSWSFDAHPASGLQGGVEITDNISGYSAPEMTVYVREHGGGRGSGRVSVVAPVVDGHYLARVPPGAYHVNLQARFPLPSDAYVDGPVTLEQVGEELDEKSLSAALRSLSLPVQLGGFRKGFELIHGFGDLVQGDLGQDPSTWRGSRAALNDAGLSFPVTPGIWRPWRLTFLAVDVPSLVFAFIDKYFFDDLSLPPVTISGANHAYPSHTMDLVEATIYLDVAEPVGAEPLLLSEANVFYSKDDYNQLGLLQSRVVGQALQMRSAPTELVALTLLAEPGEYALKARARLGNSTVAFPESTIVFGVPVAVPAGATGVTWSPDAQQDVQISLDFFSTAERSVSVAKTTQGPPPPEGFTAMCTPWDVSATSCPPSYYDIRTSVPPSGPAELCVRQAFDSIAVGDLDGVLASVGLYHFKTGVSCDHHLPPYDPLSCWERLGGAPPTGGLPSGKPLVANCATNLAACGCATAADCGIAQGVSVLQLCGLTSSFSPFAVLQPPRALLGATSTGATGAVQSWQAPLAGVYRVRAVGARGGAGTGGGTPTVFGGCGAVIEGEVALAAGEMLQILVGQQGLSTALNGGGGGGSFVVRNGAPLIVAGGGGGVRYGATVNGRDASLTSTGVPGSTSPGYTTGFIPGGSNGGGGSRATNLGSGGGGWAGNGAADGTNGEGGFAFLLPRDPGRAGRGGRGLRCDGPPYADGGFGGGGAGNGCSGGGGGGGYSGGGGGRVAGGGGSWNAGANPHAGIQCTPDGHGRVELQWLRP